MTKQAAITKREKSLSENIIIIAGLGIMMASFIFYFFKQEQQLTQTGFGYVAGNFSSRVMAIRAQWFMENQPSMLKVNDENAKLISVNRQGWVDYQNAPQNCEKIWRAVMDSELVFMKQPIVVILLEKTLHQKDRSCRYGLPSGEYFDYHMNRGQVGKVKLRQL